MCSIALTSCSPSAHDIASQSNIMCNANTTACGVCATYCCSDTTACWECTQHAVGNCWTACSNRAPYGTLYFFCLNMLLSWLDHTVHVDTTCCWNVLSMPLECIQQHVIATCTVWPNQLNSMFKRKENSVPYGAQFEHAVQKFPTCYWDSFNMRLKYFWHAVEKFGHIFNIMLKCSQYAFEVFSACC
jgi:hypothetical protein